MCKSLRLPWALNAGEQATSCSEGTWGGQGWKYCPLALPTAAQSTPEAATAGRPYTTPQPPQADGGDIRGCHPAPAAQDAASRSSGAHVARCFLSSFSLHLLSPPGFLSQRCAAKRGCFISAGLWSGLPWKEGIGSVLLQTCLVKAEREGNQSQRGQTRQNARERPMELQEAADEGLTVISPCLFRVGDGG